VRLSARAAAVDAHGVDLVDGTRLAADTVICTIGARSNPLVDQLAVTTLRGRIVTKPDGQVAGRPGLWALGDCAATVNAADGQTSPPTAQFAVAQAQQLARNLVAQIEGRATRAFQHRSKGMMATTGHHKGVAQLLGVPLTGLPAWLVWRAYYLMLMPTLGRKVRIWVEWTWSLFFPVDITHLRFTRTADVDMPFAAPAPATPIHHPQP
jgi:NADH:ubiquinone reductase (H+-translocating)